MQPTAHSSVSSEPEGRRSTKGRSLWRSGGSCPDHADDYYFDVWPRGGHYGDQVGPVLMIVMIMIMIMFLMIERGVVTMEMRLILLALMISLYF